MSPMPKAAFVGMLFFCLCPRHQTVLRAQALHVPTRCMCLKFQEKVNPRFIMDFQIIEKGAHCHRHEIILTVRLERGPRETCLDLSKKQGKDLLHCWKRNLKNPRKQHHCMRRGQRHRTRAKQ
ncbi:interleukin-8-like [Mauremys mutica]|uniref:interleukin-8-like n=1 Tax=Mauremys mutica TaxID=74926 RepID=UPI001D15EB67|nr:interleukin-8-like [Mauremys mutica]